MPTIENPKISIIIPAYNIENYIGQCLESLINQTYKNIEIIVVNDGSKDNTLSIINEYAQKDKRIKVINQENQGLSESRNNAIEIIDSQTEYVMFVDGDDWVDLDMCETCVDEMKKEKPDIVWFSYVREYENNAINKGAFEEDRIIFKNKDVKEKLQRRIYGPYESELSNPEKLDSLSPVWGKLYKKEVVQNHKFKSFKEIGATCEDVFFNTEVLENVKKVVYINKNFYHYRKFNPNSVTKAVDEKLFEKWKKAYFLLNKIVDEKGYDDTYKRSLNNRFSINLIAIGLRIINGANKFSEKYKMINEILNDEVYCNAISGLDISYMPIHWKMFFCNAKHKITAMVYILLIIMSALSSKK